jgi:hypothetical protein
MTESNKKLYEAEKKALSCLKMSLPQEILHLFNGFNTSKELWLALKNHCEGDETLKKNRRDLLKHQYNVFNGLRSENLDQLITRYYHLLAELQAFEVTYSEEEKVEKFLSSLPEKWSNYITTLQEKADFSDMSLTQIVAKFRGQEMKLKRREAGYNNAQIPELYYGRPTINVSPGSPEGSTRAFLSEDVDLQKISFDSEGNICLVSSQSDNVGNRGYPTSSASSTVPISVKCAESHLSVLASFVTSYEQFIQGKVQDPSLIDDDYE